MQSRGVHLSRKLITRGQRNSRLGRRYKRDIGTLVDYFSKNGPKLDFLGLQDFLQKAGEKDKTARVLGERVGELFYRHPDRAIQEAAAFDPQVIKFYKKHGKEAAKAMPKVNLESRETPLNKLDAEIKAYLKSPQGLLAYSRYRKESSHSYLDAPMGLGVRNALITHMHASAARIAARRVRKK